MGIGLRIAEARKAKGWSQGRLGEAVGAGQTTVSSWERERTEPTREDVQRVAEALGLSLAEIEIGGLAEDGARFVAAADDRGVLYIRGDVRTGAWLETGDTDQREPERYPAAADPRYPRLAQWLSRVRGDSMNALTKKGMPAGILDGDLVHLVDAMEIDYQPATGDIVEVERVRFDGAEREVTLKQVEVLADGSCLLWPRSTNPRWQEPIPYREGVQEAEEIEVRVRGKMLQVLRPF